MASPLVYALPPNFDLPTTVGQLGLVFQRKGYTVRSYPMGAGACLELSKNTGGLNTALGRCEGIKVNFMPGVNLLNVSFSDEQWTDKIIGFVLGWFTCWIPWIFTIIGLFGQIQLPKQVDNELRRILGTASVAGNGYVPPAAGQPPYQYYQSYQPPVQNAPQTPPAQNTPQTPPTPQPPQAPPAEQTPPPVRNPFQEGNPFDNPFEAKTPPAPGVCRSCGKPLPADSQYCNHCDAKQ